MNQYYKNKIYRESVKKDIAGYDSEEYANKLYNAVYDEGEYLCFFTNRIVGLFHAVILFVFFFDILAKMHAVFMISAFLLAIKNLIYNSRKNNLNYKKHIADLKYLKSNQSIRNFFYLKEYGKENHLYPIGELFLQKYRDNRKNQWDENKEIMSKQLSLDAFNDIFNSLIYIFSIMVLFYLLMEKNISAGDFNLVITNISTTADNIENIIMFLPLIRNDSSYIKDISAITDQENFSFPETAYEKTDPRIIFENVSFSYNKERDVLRNLNITIPLNEKIAIVGENGSGKSTLINLLLGLYRPDSGAIHYYYNKEQVHDSSQLFGVMPQNFHLFAVSIAENILLKDTIDEHDRIRLEEAVRFSGLENKIEQLSDGADTELTGEFCETGICLSGGELQKAAIARAYIMERPILILDEPSSSLDPISEKRLIEKINKSTEGKAVFVITHNMSFAKNADRVLVLHQGEIMEYGTPDELIKRDGYFRKMLNEQIRAERE